MNVFMRVVVSVALVTLWSGRGWAGESFVVVRLADMLREDAYQVMSGDEFKQLQKQLALEERNFQKAVAQAADEWRKDEMNKTTPFPGNRLAPRKVIGQAETFASRDKADERLNQYETREGNKRARELDKAKKTKSAVEKAKEDREMDKLLQARRAADAVAAKLSALTGTEVGAPAAGPLDKNAKPEEKKAVEKKADGKKDEKGAADKKDAGAALNKAL